MSIPQSYVQSSLEATPSIVNLCRGRWSEVIDQLNITHQIDDEGNIWVKAPCPRCQNEWMHLDPNHGTLRCPNKPTGYMSCGGQANIGDILTQLTGHDSESIYPAVTKLINELTEEQFGQQHQFTQPPQHPPGATTPTPEVMAQAQSIIPESVQPIPQGPPPQHVHQPMPLGPVVSEFSLLEPQFDAQPIQSDPGEILGSSFTMHSDAFHGILGEIARGLDPFTEADQAGLLMHLLTYAGAYIGPGPHFDISGSKHPTRLFTVAVGATSSGRKGTAGAYPRELFSRLDPQFVRLRTMPGLSTGEGLIHAVRDPAGDDTGVPDKRLLVVEEEFGGALVQMKKHGSILSQIIRQGWDTGNLSQIVRHNPYSASNAHICLIGHITQDELLQKMDKTDVSSGFANRILWFVTRRSKLLPNPQPVPEQQMQDYASRLGHAMQFAQASGVVTRDQSASQLWEEWYEGLMSTGSTITDRAAPYVVRLSLLYALLDCCSQVQEVHLRAARAVWNYCERSTRAIFLDPRKTNADAKKLWDFLLQCPTKGATRTEVSQLFGRNRSKEQIDEITRSLADFGLLESKEVIANGSKTIRYFSRQS